MRRALNREKILTEGLRLVHERGFGGASIRDIVQAAGVPQGSFTNHFPTKEAFGIEILDLYHSHMGDLIRATLRNDEQPPLERLSAYIDHFGRASHQDAIRRGCLFGNLAAEMTDRTDPLRRRLLTIFSEVEDAIAQCLRAGVQAGEISQRLDCREISRFIFASLQGAVLLSKVERDTSPVDRFKMILFTTVLRS